MLIRIIILLFSSLLICGCSGSRNEERLTHIAAIVSDSPDDALAMLDSIEYDRLSEADRHFYDFLSIKANDKAYVRHRSDSLILDVMHYYSSHGKDNMYPEALYYGGRVYSDLGDLPNALRYFHDALDELPEDTEDHDLRARILSQTGRLLNKLRLYEEAIPYIESSIGIGRMMNDTINEVYDLQLLGMVYMRAHDLARADSCFRTALHKSRYLPVYHMAKSSMYIADVKYRMGQIDSALIYVRHTPDLVNSVSRNSARAVAADIYYAAGIIDTACIYAHELLNSPDFTNKKTGYWILLSPELRGQTHPDTLSRYLSEFLLIQESYFNENVNRQAIMQNSLYNYNIHEKERRNAEKSRDELIIWCWISIAFIFLLIIVVLAYRIRTKQTLIELHATIARLEAVGAAMGDGGIPPEDIDPISPDPDSLRARLREKIALIDTDAYALPPLPSGIMDSECYRTLQEYIEDGKVITDADALWDDLYTAILKGSPDFSIKLQKLMGRSIRRHELQTIILIKCGVTPVQMTGLLGKSKGAISSRREALCTRILGEKVNQKAIDTIIRSL